MIHSEASPTDSRSQAIGGQGSLRAAGYRQAKHSERRKASGQSVVAAQIFRGADSAFSGILCFVDNAATHQMVEGTAESTRCVLVCTASCAAGESRWEKLESVGVVQRTKVEVRWSARHQQSLGKDFVVSTGTESSSEAPVVRTVQPSRQRGHLKHRWW